MPHFVIIGGGIAGPTAALRLHQDGHTCTIYERAPTAQTIGGAVAIAPNGLRLMHRLGVGSTLVARGCSVTEMEVCDGTGVRLGAIPNVACDGIVGLRIMRSTFQEILHAEVRRKGIDIVFSKHLQSVSEPEGKAAVVAHFADGTTAEGDYLIGADGIHSRVRSYVCEATPTYTKLVFAYGILPAPAAPELDFANYPPTRAYFTQRGLLATVFTDESRATMLWMAGAEQETAPERSVDGARIRAEQLARYGAPGVVSPDMVRIIGATTDYFTWPVYELPRLDTWHRGRVVLVGDCAHALSPKLGQGVSAAIEDVFTLARVLAKGKGFDRYEELRIPKIDKLRNDISGTMRTGEDRGPWKQSLLTWGFWFFLSAVAPVIYALGLPSHADFDCDKEVI